MVVSSLFLTRRQLLGFCVVLNALVVLGFNSVWIPAFFESRVVDGEVLPSSVDPPGFAVLGLFLVNGVCFVLSWQLASRFVDCEV
jgi:hypothetical protein